MGTDLQGFGAIEIVPRQFLVQFSSYLRLMRSIMVESHRRAMRKQAERGWPVLPSLVCWERHSGLDTRGSAHGSLEYSSEEVTGLVMENHSLLLLSLLQSEPGHQGQ